MSRDSGAGAYSHGTACPSPMPQLAGEREAVRAIARSWRVSVVTRELLHSAPAPLPACPVWRRSALRRAEGHAADEVPLQRDVDEDRRYRRQQSSGREQVRVREELALEVVQGGRDRPAVTALHEQQCPEEVVVDKRELERRECCQSGAAQWQDYIPVDPPHRRPVGQGRLRQLA